MDVRFQQSQFEIHTSGFGEAKSDSLPWTLGESNKVAPPFVINVTDGIKWLRRGSEDGTFEQTPNAADALLGLQVLPRRLKTELLLINLRGEVLVNSYPVGPYAVVGVGDSLVASPGSLGYVTERVHPFLAKAEGGLLQKKCGFCRLPLLGRVYGCRCGAFFHHNTDEDGALYPTGQPLRCFTKLSVCLSCKRPLRLEPYLVFDPREV